MNENSSGNNNHILSIEELNNKIDCLQLYINEISRGGMLSSQDFLDLCISSEQDGNDYLKALEKGEYNNSTNEGKIYKNIEYKISSYTFQKQRARFLIKPFDPFKVTPFSYDLSIGDQLYSLRMGRTIIHSLEEDKPYYMQPKETVIVLTKEYIALPPDYSATVWPRFGPVTEGIFQSMVKIDPTWRGKLAIALTNVSPAKYPIKKGQLFATLIIYELSRESQYYLCKPEDLEGKEEKIPIPSDIYNDHNDKEINDKLKDAQLHHLFSSQKGNLVIKLHIRERKNYDKLKVIFPESSWKDFIDKAIEKIIKKREIGMKYYDLTYLSPILERSADGICLKQDDIQNEKAKVDQDILDKVAIECGHPYQYFAGIPDFVANKINKEIVPQIEGKVSSELFPKVVNLTLSVLGMLSLILAVLSIILRQYISTIKVSWPQTIIIVVVVFSVLLYIINKLIYKEKDIYKELTKKYEEIKNRLINVEEQVVNMKKSRTKNE